MIQLKPYQLIKIYFYPTSEGINEDLFFYLVHPGEEYFLHMSLWKTVPFGFKLDGKTEFMDLTMAKEVEKRDSSTSDCVDDLEYDFIGKRLSLGRQFIIVISINLYTRFNPPFLMNLLIIFLKVV